MTKVYVLIGSRGEHDTYAEETYGVFAAIDDALAAASRIKPEADAGWAARQAFDAKAVAMATERGFPDVGRRIFDKPPWSEAEHAQWRAHIAAKGAAEEELGGKPPFFLASDEYWVCEFELGVLSSGGREVVRFEINDGRLKEIAA